MPEGIDNVCYEPCAVTVSRYVKTMAQPDGQQLGGIPIVYGNLKSLPPKVKIFLAQSVALCRPKDIHICDGSASENKQLVEFMIQNKTLEPLPKYENCFLARTNPGDVARVEGKTFMCTENERDSVAPVKEGVKRSLGNWLSPADLDKAVKERFPGCMRGRTMYVIPFSMGPIGSPLAKTGVEITDSPYVVCSMGVMTRMGEKILASMDCADEFVRCLHAVGGTDGKEFTGWPCDPERTIIMHKAATNEIISYGSGYGGNSLLGKKCFALRIGSTIARSEGWLAEHMLIVGVTNPAGKKKYIAAAFPSACGKTNLAMLESTLPGFKVECVGDDIAWMKFDKNGVLRGINPENGMFGVAPGTSMKTNPNAMRTVFRNTIFTNVASTSDGGVYWEGMEEELDPNVTITDWLGNPWEMGSDKPAAHPNSRFCTPVDQLPIIDPEWENPEGVPISAIIFGGRRPEGVPLVIESFSWKHGVFLGACVRSEATAAAEFKGKVILHDPFAMRPFFGYNFGYYLAHWLSMEDTPGRTMPKIFHVNWFRKNEEGNFMWPGFCENIRVIDWILKRVDNEDVADKTAIGYVPKPGTLNVDGLDAIDLEGLFSVSKPFWEQEIQDLAKYFDENIGPDLPPAIANELEELKNRIAEL